MNNSINTGKLHVIATPIGNLSDISQRAIEDLKNVDLILTEDTRSFGKIKQTFNIQTKVISFFEQNERNKTPEIINKLLSGQNIALTSEAGTPCISDPGYNLINTARENNITVTGVPGPCAAIYALSISGFESDRFTFEGFLSKKPGKKEKKLQSSIESNTTTIFYESPFRIIKTLETLSSISPNAKIFIGRELTKIHEECLIDTAQNLLEEFKTREKTGQKSIKGEFVLIIKRQD